MRSSRRVYHELDNYLIEREIGLGSFAVVYKGHEKRNRHEVAIKAVNMEKLNKKLAENLATEINIMMELKHENIVELFDIQKADRFIYLVMEYCKGGDLAQVLRRKKVLPEKLVRLMIGQLAEALLVLSKASLVHRDLKPQNLLLAEPFKEEEYEKVVIKLADFGFATHLEPSDLAQTLCGSPLYMAPEILRYEKYDAKADLWSVGAIMYEMLYGRTPFQANNHIELLKIIERSQGIPFPESVSLAPNYEPVPIPISDECKDLIMKLLQRDPEERISFEDFIGHPFLRKSAPLNVPAERNSSALADKIQIGFNIPKRRPSQVFRTGSMQVPSAIPASFKAANLLQSNRKSAASSLRSSSYLKSSSHILPTRENELGKLIEQLTHLKPALAFIIERDMRIALALQEIAEQHQRAALEKSTLSSVSTHEASKSSSSSNEIIYLLLVSLELIQGLLKTLKETKPEISPKDDNHRALVLWIVARQREIQERINLQQRQNDETSSKASLQVGVSMCLESMEAISSQIYHFALKCAKDGGVEELLGNQIVAESLYRKAHFLLSVLLASSKPAALLNLKEPAISTHDVRIIQGCTTMFFQYYLPLH